MKLNNYSKQTIGLGDIASVVKALVSPYLTTGPAIDKVEREIAEYVGAKYCVVVSNGTAALNLLAKIVACSKVHVPDITFMATANAFDLEGHQIVLEDIEMDKPFIKKKEYPEGDIVVPVHMMGHPLTHLEKFGQATIIEDACHALGASYYDTEGKQMVGNCKYSYATVFSFHPVKPITSGEGGCITTNDEALYNELKSLRSHGIRMVEGKYELLYPSLNFRMTDIQASLLSSQLKKLDKMTIQRTELAEEYSRLLPRSITPQHSCTERPSWHLYVIQDLHRDNLREYLASKDIATQIHYQPLHTLSYYKVLSGQVPNIKFSNSNRYYKEALSLPLFPQMTKGDVKKVCNTIFEFWEK